MTEPAATDDPRPAGGPARAVEQYSARVREHLRLQGVPRARIDQDLAELAGHVADAGTDPWDDYGPPDAYARSLVEAAGGRVHPVRAWAALVAATTVLSALGTVLILRGGRPAVLPATGAAMVVPFALCAGYGSTVWAARTRDGLPRTSPLAHRGARGLLIMVAAAAALTAVWSIGAARLLGDRTIGWSTVPSWVVGLALIVPAFALLAFIQRRT